MLITCGIYLYSIPKKKILVCHATHSSWSKWSIPKGLKDAGEDSYTAAVRELKEETGVNISTLHVLQKQILPPVNYKKQKKILESFLVIIDSDLEGFRFYCTTLVNESFPEVDNWKWIEVEEIKKVLHESQQENFHLIKEMINNYFVG